MPVERFEGGYPGIEVTTYKDEPGTWLGVTRRVLAGGSGTGFETRYFAVAPGGYTSFERHGHEHVVVVVDGEGEVRLGDEIHALKPGDVVHVGPNEPHQFRSDTGLGFVCTVDRTRDRPVLLETDGSPRASD